MSLLLASAARATTGARSGQEDAFGLWPPEGVAKPEGANGGLLAVLADGMGGHTGGAVAGETACKTFGEAFAATKTATALGERLQSALNASNEALAREVEQNAGLRGMGCTLVAAWMDALGVRWTSVGDSLLLLYRFPDVIRLNADHSLGSFLDEQARQNRISATEARQHLNRNALRSALTGSKIDLIDLRGEPLELRPGDWILLASDGICSLEGDEIADVIYNYRQSKPEEMAAGLIDAVMRKGVAGQDNTTVVAVRVDEAEADATTRVVHRTKDEERALRSRRIGMTGRRTAPRRGAGRRSKRSALWLVAAAVFFVFFAATILMRALQPTMPKTTPPTEASTGGAPPQAGGSTTETSPTDNPPESSQRVPTPTKVRPEPKGKGSERPQPPEPHPGAPQESKETPPGPAQETQQPQEKDSQRAPEKETQRSQEKETPLTQEKDTGRSAPDSSQPPVPVPPVSPAQKGAPAGLPKGTPSPTHGTGPSRSVQPQFSSDPPRTGPPQQPTRSEAQEPRRLNKRPKDQFEKEWLRQKRQAEKQKDLAKDNGPRVQKEKPPAPRKTQPESEETPHIRP